MNISTTELVIFCVFFTALALMRQLRPPKNASDIDALRTIVRNEVAQMNAETRRRLLDEFQHTRLPTGAPNRNGRIGD